jgi:hypothetical protein
MADRYYGIEFGASHETVTEGAASTASLDVEVRVTYDATNNTKKAVLDALEEIKTAIYQDTWPPV